MAGIQLSSGSGIYLENSWGRRTMYECINIHGNTWYFQSPANIGLFKTGENDVVLIDSGNDKDAAKKIFSFLQSKTWNLTMIVNTHSNADHIGGNAYLYEKTHCRIAATGLEATLIEYPILESSFLFGGHPPSPLRNKFLLAQPSVVTDIVTTDEIPGTSLKAISLPGHFLDMIGVMTPDGVFFVADSLFRKEILDKYKIPFIYDVKAFLETLTLVEQTEARFFVPSHAEPTSDIRPLVQRNRETVHSICELILQCCATPTNFEALLKKIFDHYALTLDFNQYVLVGSTIKSFLSYLYGEKQIDVVFKENELLWTRG
jgi:glyoxylase-like metal-dependent hydrolase (beta-lactamase superfamily II)